MTGRPTTGDARIRLREQAARLYIEGCTIASPPARSAAPTAARGPSCWKPASGSGGLADTA